MSSLGCWRALSHHGGSYNSNIFNGSSVFISVNPLDFVYYIQALDHFAKNGVLSVKIRRATNLFIHLTYFWCQLHAAACLLVHLLLGYVKHALITSYAISNVGLSCP